jgi:hypothetical protein
VLLKVLRAEEVLGKLVQAQVVAVVKQQQAGTQLTEAVALVDAAETE